MKDVPASFWKPGSIVKLREPSMPPFRKREAYGFSLPEWREWQGFTHGIIAQVLHPAYDARVPGGEVKRVSLHLYDPETRRIDVHGPSGIPTYVDFREDELIPFKDGAVEFTGYETLV